MRLLVLTGFFGSGKTTFLVRTLRLAAREAGLRTILVQNEMGRVGVDPEVFRDGGLEVKELLGGCICCDLAARLVSVLYTLVAENSADLVCIEASGMATPGMVRQILSGTDLASLPLLQVNILDAARLQRIEKLIAMPVIRQGIEAADLCVINKIDVAPEGFRETFEAHVREIRPGARIQYANLLASETLPDALAGPLVQFFRGVRTGAAPSGAGSHHEHEHHGRPAVCALETEAASPAGHSSETLRAAFDVFIRGIGEAGGIIGHVKVAFIGKDGARYFLNSTGIGPQEGVPLPDCFTVSRAVINAIAWRIEQPVLESLARDYLHHL